jgi:hypothetical protein
MGDQAHQNWAYGTPAGRSLGNSVTWEKRSYFARCAGCGKCVRKYELGRGHLARCRAQRKEAEGNGKG